METKYITIPFDLERAKRITNKSEDGKIVTRDGRNVRIVCFDVKNEDSILALVEDEKGIEFPIFCASEGLVFLKSKSSCDLMLSVPEWTTFKDGDVVTMGWEEKPRGRYRKWISIIKSLDFFDDEISVQEYVSVVLESDEKNTIVIEFDNYSDAAKWARKPTDEEMKTLIATLVKNQDPRSKEYLKRFFPNHSNPSNIGKEYNFEPGQPVIGIDGRGEWRYDIFSHYKPEHKNGNYVCSGRSYSKCLPYNEETKHLLGTTDALEG